MPGRKRHLSTTSADSEDESLSQTIAEETNDGPNRAGQIKLIVLKNFLCHSYLEVDFECNVNFITGNNGSGKSAILAAISLGLGAKARSTNRGTVQNIKTFVKVGTSSATIEIVLKNTGKYAYNVDQFGSQIRIIRTISKTGVSLVKISTATGAMVPTKMKLIHSITEHFNIQLENPVCILSQDTARDFLNTADPKMRYNLFHRATTINKLTGLYQEAKQKQNMAMDEFKGKKMDELSLMKQAKKLQQKIKQVEEQQELRSQIKSLEGELAWCHATVVEKKYADQKALADQAANDLIATQTCLTELNDKCNAEIRKGGELQEELNGFDSQIEGGAAKFDQLAGNIRRVTNSINEEKAKISSAERELAFKTQDYESVQNLISNFNEREKTIEKEKQERLRKLSSLEKEKAEKDNLLSIFEDSISKYSEDMKEKETTHNSLQERLRSSNNKINVLNDKILHLRRDSGNPYAIYGSHYVRLISTIKAEEQNFSKPPIGPIGAHLSVKDSKWSLAVEAHLGAGLLRSFIVNSQTDAETLKRIIKSMWPREAPQPSVIAMAFAHQIYSTSRNEVAPHHNCVRLKDVISVDNPTVMNCLIDYSKIETILLLPDKALGFQIMKNYSTVPQNCRLALTPTADVFYPHPNYKMYSGRLKQPKFIQVNTRDISNQCKREIERVTESVNELKEQTTKIQNESRTIREEMTRLKQKAAKTAQELSDIKGQIQRLNSQAVNTAGSIDDLVADSEQLQKQINDKILLLSQRRTKLEELNDELKELDRLTEGQVERNVILEKIETSKRIVQSLKNELNRAKAKQEEKEKLVTDQHACLLQLKNDWLETEARLQETHGDRPRELRRPIVIEEKLNDINQQLQRQTSYDITKIQAEYNLINDRIEVNREVMADLHATLIELDKKADGRRKKLVFTKKYLKEYAKHHFIHFLKCRNFQGNMNINYDEETLDIIVMPSGRTKATSSKELSGGERSFATVAFLYSLWKTLDFPFYILDEFDVYMDAQNRSTSIKILIHHAKSNMQSQYVFLTPQDVSFIKDDAVAIHRMENPERRQVT